MIKVHLSKNRGFTDLGWLKSYHTFSFGDYYDPSMMGFRNLRVINQDRVEAGQGFGSHPHRDMEIMSYVLEGALEHKDSMGTGSVIRPGELQMMSAGSGVTHSEFNASQADEVHFLQIWIIPDKKNLPPSYQQKRFSDEQKDGKLCLLASHDARDGSLKIHQDVSIYAGGILKGQRIDYPLNPRRFAWIQAIQGAISLNGQTLRAGDGASMSEETLATLTSVSGQGRSEFLLFDLN